MLVEKMENNTEENISTSFTELNNIELETNKNICLKIGMSGYNYNFFVKIVDKSENIVVFCPNELNFTKKALFEKIFSEDIFSYNLQFNVIYFDFPITDDFSDFTTSFGMGKDNLWHFDNISKIIQELSNIISHYKHNEIENKLYFYGSSMGGFISLILSVLLKNSTSIADVPQTNLTMDNNWIKVKKQFFDKLTDDEIQQDMYRFKVYDLIIKQNVIPNAYIILDTNNKQLWNTQWTDFINKLDKLPYNYNKMENNIHIKIDNREDRSNLLEKEEVILLIDNVINIQKRRNSFNSNSLKMINEFEKGVSLMFEDYFKKNISFSELIKLKNRYSNKWSINRLDIQNIGNESNSIEILDYDDSINISYPEWLKTDQGQGCILSSNSKIQLKIKCINDGNLKLKFMGPAYDVNKRKIPIYVCYNSFKFNEELHFFRDKLVWHNKPFVFTKKVKNNEIFTLEIDFMTIYDYYPYIYNLMKMDETEENIGNTYRKFISYVNYIRLLNNPFYL